jgi:hypothetical protein
VRGEGTHRFRFDPPRRAKAVSAPFPASHRTPKPRGNSDGSGPDAPTIWRGLGPEPGKDAFHRVPGFARNEWDSVERASPHGIRGIPCPGTRALFRLHAWARFIAVTTSTSSGVTSKTRRWMSSISTGKAKGLTKTLTVALLQKEAAAFAEAT